jgi:hypothetical protein
VPRTCRACRSFDHATPRAETATLVRCFEERNREGVWLKIVSGEYAACRHYTPTPIAAAEEALCDLMML